MKRYIAPEIEIVSFEAENVILTSGQIPMKSPKTLIDGEEATGIGAVLFSDYTWS